VAANVAYTANGRCDVQNLTFDAISSGNPRLYFADVILGNVGSAVTARFQTNRQRRPRSHLCHQRSTVSGFNAIGFTGYNKDMIVESGAQHSASRRPLHHRTMDTGLANTGNGWYVKGSTWLR